jgi:hypothetical protein
MLAVPIFLSGISYGDISFDTNPYVHSESPDINVDFDNSPSDGYIFEMNQNGRTINPAWHRFTPPAGIFYDPCTDNTFVAEYISQGNYLTGELNPSGYDFGIKKTVVGYSLDEGLAYGSASDNFYVNEYKGNALNRFSINVFDDLGYEKSYDLNSLISEMYIVILIGLLVFSIVRVRMRFRSV